MQARALYQAASLIARYAREIKNAERAKNAEREKMKKITITEVCTVDSWVDGSGWSCSSQFEAGEGVYDFESVEDLKKAMESVDIDDYWEIPEPEYRGDGSTDGLISVKWYRESDEDDEDAFYKRLSDEMLVGEWSKWESEMIAEAEGE